MAQFPTNNYDSTHGGVDENNNPNTPEIANANKGKARTGNALYSDKHYLDGDGFLYGLGMASLRQIVKGKNDDIENYFWWNGGKSTTAKLGLNITAVEEAIKGAGLFISAGRLNVNVQSPLTITNTGSSGSAVALNGSKFIDWLGHGGSDFGLDNTLSYYTSDGRHMLGFNRSTIGQGLKVVTESGQQYRIDVMPGDYTEIKTMGDSGNQYTAVDVDIPALFAQVTRDKSIYGIGITPNSDASHSNNLYIDGSVLAGDGLQGTGYSDSDTTVTPKLKLKIASGSPLYIDTNKALNLRIGDGLIVTNTSTAPTLQFAMGSGFVKNGESIDLKTATTSEIGGVKLGTDTAPDEGMNASNLYLLKNSSDVAYVKTYVYSSFPQGSGARYYPYSADYINQNYSTKTEVTAEIAAAVSDISGREYKIFTDWPAPPTNPTKEQWDEFYATYKKYIALKSTGGTDPDAYEERILIRTNESTGECRWEKIGDTKFTTDNFVAKTDVLTQAEVASIVQDVFGF